MSDVTSAFEDRNQPPASTGAEPQPSPQAPPVPPAGGFDPQQLIADTLAQMGADLDFGVPQVIVGYDQVPTVPVTGTGPGLGRIPTETQPRLAGIDQAVELLVSAPSADLSERQHELFIAGFYDASVDAGDIRWGIAGPETIRAAARFMEWAAAFRTPGDGEQVPWWEALEMLVDETAGGGPGGAAARPPVEVRLSDPAGLHELVDQTFRQVAGRKATTAAKRAFAALIHRLQRAQQLRSYDARLGDPGDVTEVQQVDVAGRAARFARDRAPEGVLDVEVRGAAEGLRRAARG